MKSQNSQRQIPPNPPLKKGGAKGRRRKSAAWIQYQLKLKKTSQAAIGRELTPPVSKNMVSHVVLGKVKTRRVRERIAAVLGLEFEQVWGGQ
jgi:hypothetical protein